MTHIPHCQCDCCCPKPQIEWKYFQSYNSVGKLKIYFVLFLLKKFITISITDGAMIYNLVNKGNLLSNEIQHIENLKYYLFECTNKFMSVKNGLKI